MSSRHASRRVRSLGKLAAIALTLITPLATTASAQTQLLLANESSQSVYDALTAQERAALEGGQVMVSAARDGDSGQFVARVLIDAPVAQAWEVLTDYDNFEKFLPNIENSELLESEDNRRVFEQRNVISVVPSVLEINSRVVIESTEAYPKTVDFRLVDGDLDALQGVWQLDPVVTDEAGTEQVLITHRVNIDPGNSSPRGLFFSTYRLVLEDSLVAAKAETEKRAKALANLP
ncbi:Streptomyces cyclase/dehydrase family [Synechococcus sp. PCC 7335]|uniref:SRPBCC family protein n=1 Tax=Synechococcus sp. (strain ATCC 29403 / PCC 7335) TaxID=91464 RepID=UPI00017EC721|nr:SRPBCC family protein [Synechococcus sp. PCC 7335]EDX86426.1 Streptomyces cyclase/dehydrase family [Synechococcus sp. PCC 7335]